MDNKSHFSAIVQLKDGFEDQFDVTLDKNATDLTYDEVYDAVCNAVDAEYKFSTEDFEAEDDSPYSVVDIVINEDGESYPVVSESDVTSIDELKTDKECKKFLVLPDALYSLTPECKMWMQLKEAGIIDEDAPFDFAKYHSLVKQSGD